MTRIGQPTNWGLLDARYVLTTGDTMTGNLTISNTAPSLILTDTTASAKSLTIAVDADIVDLRESAGASGSLMVLDLANGRVGIGTTGPVAKFQVTGVSSLNYGAIFGNNDFIKDVSGSDLLIDFGATTGNTYTRLSALSAGQGAWNNLVLQSGGGNVGIGTTSPTNLLSLGGNSARIFWMERHTTANTAGNTLTITAGGATSGATDKAGGALILQGGLSTGTGESGVQIYGCVAGATGTADRTQTVAIQTLGNKIGFYAVTPVVRPTALTTQLTTITATAPGTPDYLIQNLVQNTGFGFVTADEGQSVLKVILNLQTRVAELETKLQGLGLLT